MIYALTTLDSETLRPMLEAQGMVLAPAKECGHRLILVGRRDLVDGSISDTFPALELVALDGNAPVYHTVALHSSGTWQPFDGVSFLKA